MKNKLLILFLAVMAFSLPAFAGSNNKTCYVKSTQKAKDGTPICKCAKPVETCLRDMVKELKTTGFIGVELDFGNQEGQLIVTKVIEGSPAEKAGIRAGDELYSINGIRFSEKNGEAISKVKLPGKTVTCTVKRNGADREFKLMLVPMPADLMAKYIGEHMMEHAIADAEMAKK